MYVTFVTFRKLSLKHSFKPCLQMSNKIDLLERSNLTSLRSF